MIPVISRPISGSIVLGILLLFSSFSVAAFNIPLGIRGELILDSDNASAIHSSEQTIHLRFENLRTKYILERTVAPGPYRVTLPGTYGDNVSITATAGILTGQRIVQLKGVLDDVTIRLSTQNKNSTTQTYPEPSVSGVPIPYGFFGSIRGPVDNLSFIRHINGKSFLVVPEDHRYVTVVSGYPGDSISISDTRGPFSENITLQQPWIRIDIDTTARNWRVVAEHDRPTIPYPEEQRFRYLFILTCSVLILVVLALFLRHHFSSRQKKLQQPHYIEHPSHRRKEP